MHHLDKLDTKTMLPILRQGQGHFQLIRMIALCFVIRQFQLRNRRPALLIPPMRKMASASYHPAPLSKMGFVVGETGKQPPIHTDTTDRVRKALRDQRSEGAYHPVRYHRLIY